MANEVNLPICSLTHISGFFFMFSVTKLWMQPAMAKAASTFKANSLTAYIIL